jgi:choline monooxygenase
MKYTIDPDIRRASTLPGNFYTDEQVLQKLKESVFYSSWQYIGSSEELKICNTFPKTLLPDFIDEPLLLTKDSDGQLFCLSNVCTHRANLVCTEPARKSFMRCNYHGRCFSLNGKFRSMPGFKEVSSFPTDDDHLQQLSLSQLGPLLFTRIKEGISFDQWISPLRDRMHWFDFDGLHFSPKLSKTYQVNAHWALYCDNYLEGFHVPFVHPRLGKSLDSQAYRTEIFDFCNLQLGVAKEGEPHFILPESSQDSGLKIFAYYWWLFPNLMLNFYPWGLSLNIVEPKSLKTTRIRFLTFLFNLDHADKMMSTYLDETEMEDEAVVENVQKGVQSVLYQKGRFSPSEEKGVHHFHQLIARNFSL